MLIDDNLRYCNNNRRRRLLLQQGKSESLSTSIGFYRQPTRLPTRTRPNGPYNLWADGSPIPFSVAGIIRLLWNLRCARMSKIFFYYLQHDVSVIRLRRRAPSKDSTNRDCRNSRPMRNCWWKVAPISSVSITTPVYWRRTNRVI